MALNLMKAGHELLVHDVRRERCGGASRQGRAVGGEPRDAAVDRELILTLAAGARQGGARRDWRRRPVIHGAARGAIYTDLSTGSPTVMRKLHGRVESAASTCSTRR